MIRSFAADLVTVVGYAGILYFLGLTTVHAVVGIVGWRTIEEYVRRRPLRDYGWVGRSPLTMPVSVLMPAYDEGPTIVPAVRALLASQFVNLEVLVVNDGSRDDTFERLREGLALYPADRVPRANVPSAPVRGVWASAVEPGVTVIDKENGGKADALNAGLRYARFPLVCAIDADTLLDPEALSRLVWEFQASPHTVATGGIVRIVNGSLVRDGRLLEVRTPASMVGNIQILEYLRAFLGSRVGWSRLGMVVIISGAFGLFRRDAVVEIGGYDTGTVGEDAELVLRLHRHFRERGRPCRVTFFPDPICWTEAPGDLRTVVRQRDRWQRGLLEMLWKHRVMIGNPRYGRIGVLAVPYYVLFEALGPFLEIAGFVAVVLGAATGVLPLPVLALFFGVAVSNGFLLSFLALLLEERAFRRYPSWRCLRRLVVAAVVENLGYRQLMTLVRVRAWWTLLRGSGGWGAMPRAGFGDTAAQDPPSGEAADVAAA
jgi:cellulose synthase/poly-beta-1,6-N-acetylglucosamine synthase-like glycosyltransferase